MADIIEIVNIIGDKLIDGEFNWTLHLINLLIVFFVFLYEEKNFNQNDNNIYSLLIKFMIGSVSSAAVMIFLHNDIVSIIFSPTIGIFSSKLVYDKFFADNKKDMSKKEIKYTDNEEELVKEKDTINLNVLKNLTIPGEDIEIQNVNISDLTLIHILELYGFIGRNHKIKALQQSIFSTTDEIPVKLLDMNVLEPDELKLANAILNLIRYKKDFVTREEVMKFLKEINIDND